MLRTKHLLLGLALILLCTGPATAVAVVPAQVTPSTGGEPRTAPAAASQAGRGPAATPDRAASKRDKRPNIVLMQTDDQTLADLAVMKKARTLLQTRGVTFNQMVTP